MSRDLKIGDWVDCKSSRRLVVDTDVTGYWIVSITKSKTLCSDFKNDLVHLPDCTGWDWQPKPIEPPPGYRLLSGDEIIKEGDQCLVGTRWGSTGATGLPVELAMICCTQVKAYARKIEPKYRPFANAAEFEPHRDRWIKCKLDGGSRARVISYNEKFIILGDGDCGYNQTFEEFVFEDGTPFGVIDI